VTPRAVISEPRLRDQPRVHARRNSDREPINIHPDTRNRLIRYLNDVLKGTGIGYTEFIEQSLDLWERIDQGAYEETLNNVVEDERIEAMMPEIMARTGAT
jgi:hypothetical protein